MDWTFNIEDIFLEMRVEIGSKCIVTLVLNDFKVTVISDTEKT